MELQIKDIARFYGCCYDTARLRKKEIMRGLNLPKNKTRILLVHVAKYEGLKVSEVKEILEIYGK